MKLALALGATLVAFAAFPGTEAQESPSDVEPSGRCARWSVKGLRLGMSLVQVRDEHPKLKHGKNWFRPDDRGRRWYFWAESRKKGLYNYVLPETDKPEAPIVSILALIDLEDSTPSDAIAALERRWGPALAKEVNVATVRYFNVSGAPQGEYDWTATVWEDAACDVLVTAFEKNTLSPATTLGLLPMKIEVTVLTVSIDSLSKEIARREAEKASKRDEADDATHP